MSFLAGHTVQYPCHSPHTAVIVEIWDHTLAELDSGQRVPLTALCALASDEQWRPVTGFEELYRISSHGKVVSLQYKRTARHRLLRVLSPRRYPSVSLYSDLTTQQIGLNRLVALHFLAPPTEARFNHVMPKDGNHLNLRAENLQWVDQAERKDQTVLQRFHACRARNTHSKLTAESVQQIRALAARGYSNQALAVQFGVSRPTISYVVRGKTWRTV